MYSSKKIVMIGMEKWERKKPDIVSVKVCLYVWRCLIPRLINSIGNLFQVQKITDFESSTFKLADWFYVLLNSLLVIQLPKLRYYSG